MHRPALAGRGFGVYAPGQQGMGEVDPVAVDRDDAVAFRVLEQLDQAVVVASRRGRHQLHGRRSHARCREQRIMHVGIEAAEPGPHDLGQRAWQRCLDTRRAFGDSPCQFNCIERVSARHFVNPAHRRARKGSPQPRRYRCVQIVDTQRTQSNSGNRVRAGHLQPGRAGAVDGVCAHTAKNADRPGEPPRRERHHVHARWVDPLQVIDRQQQRPAVGEVFDDRKECRGHGALIGGGVVVRPHQHLIDRQALGFGQVSPSGCGHPVQQIGQGRVGQHGFGRCGARRQHPEALLLRQVQGFQPEGGLADAWFALDQQSRRLRSRRRQEASDHPILCRTALHGHSRHSSNNSS